MDDAPIERNESSEGMAKIVYILYIASIVVGITSIVGVVIAYISKDEAPDWLKTHYRFQIRTFWIGMLYSVIGIVTSIVLIGWLVLLFTLVWFIIRCIKGIQGLDKKAAHPNPTTWMF